MRVHVFESLHKSRVVHLIVFRNTISHDRYNFIILLVLDLPHTYAAADVLHEFLRKLYHIIIGHGSVPAALQEFHYLIRDLLRGNPVKEFIRRYFLCPQAHILVCVNGIEQCLARLIFLNSLGDCCCLCSKVFYRGIDVPAGTLEFRKRGYIVLILNIAVQRNVMRKLLLHSFREFFGDDSGIHSYSEQVVTVFVHTVRRICECRVLSLIVENGIHKCFFAAEVFVCVHEIRRCRVFLVVFQTIKRDTRDKICFKVFLIQVCYIALIKNAL